MPSQVLAWAKHSCPFSVRCGCHARILLLFQFLNYILDSELELFIWFAVEQPLMCNPVIRETPFCTILCFSNWYQLEGAIIYS